MLRFRQRKHHNRARVAIDQLGKVEAFPVGAIGELGRAVGHPNAFPCRRGESQHGDVLIIVLDGLGLRKGSRETLRTLHSGFTPDHKLHR